MRRPQIATWVAMRVIRALAIFLVATFALFLLIQVLPGDAATASVGRHGTQVVEETRVQLGLDQPLVVRYGSWLAGFVTGDLGASLVTGQPVVDSLRIQLLSSLTVAGIVMGFLLLVTIPLAFYLGYSRGPLEKAASSAAVVVSAIPEFITAILLLLIFSQLLNVLPVLSAPGGGKTVWEHPISLVLPSLALWTICSAPLFRRVVSLVDTHANSPYIKDTRLAGLSRPRILFGHLLPAVSHGIAQLLAQTVPYLLGGTVVVETVTSFPGLGYALVQAVGARETPLVMAIGAWLMVAALACYTVADLLGKRQERMRAVV